MEPPTKQPSPENLNPEKLNPEKFNPEKPKPEILIALLGVTGAGKTTFARLVSGNTTLKVGHTIHSCTQDPELVHFDLDHHPIVLIDTPGFDDDSRTDVEILEELAAWIAQNGHLKDKQLDGLILLHPITVLRAGGAERKRTRLLKNILGPKAYKHIVIATTMHEHLNLEANITERVDGRRHELWGDMVNQGTTLTTHRNTKESAEEIIRMIIKISKKSGKLRALLQDELYKDPRLIETTAGKDVKKQLEEEIKKITTQLAQNMAKRPKRPPQKKKKSQAGIDARRAWREWQDDQKELEDKLGVLRYRLKRLNSLSFKFKSFWAGIFGF